MGAHRHGAVTLSFRKESCVKKGGHEEKRGGCWIEDTRTLATKQIVYSFIYLRVVYTTTPPVDPHDCVASSDGDGYCEKVMLP